MSSPGHLARGTTPWVWSGRVRRLKALKMWVYLEDASIILYIFKCKLPGCSFVSKVSWKLHPVKWIPHDFWCLHVCELSEWLGHESNHAVGDQGAAAKMRRRNVLWRKLQTGFPFSGSPLKRRVCLGFTYIIIYIYTHKHLIYIMRAIWGKGISNDFRFISHDDPPRIHGIDRSFILSTLFERIPADFPLTLEANEHEISQSRSVWRCFLPEKHDIHHGCSFTSYSPCNCGTLYAYIWVMVGASAGTY